MAVTFVFEASRTLKSRGTQMSRIVRFWSFARFYAGKSPAFSGRVRSCRGREREREPAFAHLFSSNSNPATVSRRATYTATTRNTSLFVHHSTDPQSDVARARSWAAIYVQDFDAPCVLQFAWISALCCALHRSTSLVIHRSGSYKNDILRLSLSSV